MFNWLKNFFDKQRFGAVRSPQWSSVRNKYIKANPNCAVCGTTKGTECHHCVPFHIKPELELDPENFITLCRDHHYLFGHFMNWHSYNINVREDSKLWAKKISTRP